METVIESMLVSNKKLWRSYPECLKERHSAAAAALKRDGESFCVVVAGGRDVRGKQLAEAEMYEIATNMWWPLPSMHSQRFGCGSAAIEDTVMVVGGQHKQKILDTAEYWTHGSPDWKRMPSMDTPRAFCSAASLPQRNILVVMGGRNSTSAALDSVIAFDTQKEVWKDLAPMNTARMGCTAVAIDSSRIMVIGGFDGNSWLSTAEIYSLADNNWEILPAPLPIRCGFSAAAITTDEKLVVVAGGRNASQRLNDVQCYNLESSKWMVLPHGTGREGSCAAAFGDTVLIIGGSPGPDTFAPPSQSCEGWHLNASHKGEILTLGDATLKTPQDADVLNAMPLDREGSVIRAIAMPVQEDSSILTDDREHGTKRQSSIQHAATLAAQTLTRVENSLLYKNGQCAWYSGYVDSNTLPHDKGRITYDYDGSTYDGDWWHGVREGFGKSTFANADTYEGSFHKDKLHGKGTFQWCDGRQYEGHYFEDQRCGPGKLAWKNGTQYEGEFRDSRPGGVGKMKFPCGTVYDGFFEKGKFQGLGNCMHSDGRLYRGEFQKVSF